MPVVFGTVGFTPATNYAAGANPALATGKQGEQIVAQAHGRLYTPALAGNVFSLATAVAGVTIPVQATNVASVFTLWNPNTSTKNIELLTFSLGITNATTVVGDVGLYYQSGLTSPGGTLTALAIRNTNLGSSAISSQCTGYSANTLVNTVGTNMFRLLTLTSFGAVTTTNASPIFYNFDGKVVMPPGSLVTVLGSAAQTQAMTIDLSFAEWPV